MSTQDNISEVPDDSKISSYDVQLVDVFRRDYAASINEDALEIRNQLKKLVAREIIETNDEKRRRYFEQSPITKLWKNRLKETNNFDDLKADTLGGVVQLHADYTQFKKDTKQFDVNEVKMELRAKREESKEKLEEMREKLEAIKSQIAEVEELGQNLYDLHKETDDLDEILYVERDKRRYKDSRLAKRFKEYLLELRIPKSDSQLPLEFLAHKFEGILKEVREQRDAEPSVDEEGARSEVPPSSESEITSLSEVPPPLRPKGEPNKKPPRDKRRRRIATASVATASSSG